MDTNSISRVRYVHICIYFGTTILILLIYWTHLENWRNNVDPQTLVFTKQYYNQYQYWILKMINWHFAAYLRHLKTRCGLQENSDTYTTNNFAQQTYYSNIKTLVLTTKKHRQECNKCQSISVTGLTSKNTLLETNVFWLSKCIVFK